MQGIEKITNRIRQDADTEGSAFLAEARRDAETLADEFRQKAAELSSTLSEQYERAAADRESRLTSAAALEARKAQLAVRQELLDEAFAGALQKLTALPAADKQKLLARLAAEAASNGGEVVLNAEDGKAIGAKVVEAANKLLIGQNKQELTLSGSTHTAQGGLLLRSGDVTVNCTYETILKQKREEMAGEIAALLFS